MKNTIFYLTAVCLLSIASCKKIDSFTQFDMSVDGSFTVPSTSVTNLPIDLYTPEMTTNSQSTFQNHNTSIDNIEEVTLKEVRLTITSPSGEDFGFLKSVEVFIKASGISEQKIAWKTSIPANQASPMYLDLSSANLKEFVKKDKISLRVKTTTDEALSSDYDININSIFRVDAKILGQ